jgi:hypothetical protein
MDIGRTKRRIQSDEEIEENKKRKSIFDSLFSMEEDEDAYIEEVADYFNNLDKPTVIPYIELPICSNISINDITIGQQIQLVDDNSIYGVLLIDFNKQILTVFKINEPNEPNQTINLRQVKNIININPESLEIDSNYLSRLYKINTGDFDENREGTLLKIKHLNSLLNVSKIKLKIFEGKPIKNDVAISQLESAISKYRSDRDNALAYLSNYDPSPPIEDYINKIKGEFRRLYGINNIANTVNFFNRNILILFGANIDEDKLIKQYILLCDSISLLGVGLFTASIANICLSKQNYILSCINIFINKNNMFGNYFLNNVLFPSIAYFLFYSMDTAYLTITNNLDKITNISEKYYADILNLVNYLQMEKNKIQEPITQELTPPESPNKSCAVKTTPIKSTPTRIKDFSPAMYSDIGSPPIYPTRRIPESSQDTGSSLFTSASIASNASTSSVESLSNLQNKLKENLNNMSDTIQKLYDSTKLPEQEKSISSDIENKIEIIEQDECSYKEGGRKRKYKTNKYKKTSKKSKISKKNKRVKHMKKTKKRRNNRTRK